MRDYELDAAINKALSDSPPKSYRNVEEVLGKFFDQIEYYYREKEYSLSVIYAGFKEVGLVDCSLSYFKVCYYKARKKKGSSNYSSIDVKEAQTKASSKSKEVSLGVSREPDESSEGAFDAKAAMESIFGSSKLDDENNKEGEDKDEGDISSPPDPPSFLTEEMAAKLIQNKKLFDERIRRMGVVRD